MRVLVCGGRDFLDSVLLGKVLDGLTPRPTLILHGAARGADRLAGEFASAQGIAQRAFPAQWSQFGREKRVAQMLSLGKPELVVAFPGGRGTADMVRKARAAGVRVMAVFPNGVTRCEAGA